ncbi:MAG: hypothetical protein JWN92_1333, partial [Candidatus Acidoferrum typicum]|nr:hypothetical protein [Candidatus Acidoferrum typicum]
NTTLTAGTPGTFTVTATGLPAPTFAETGSLPAGVTFNTSTGVIAGTPNAGTGGVYSITFTALNGVGTNATQNFTLTVDQAPAITSASSKSFTVNAPGTFTVISTGPPAPSLVESGTLPAGVIFTDNGNGTGTLAGTASAQGTFPITFTAHNGIGVDAVQNFTLTVDQAPSFTSVTTTTFTTGSAGTFTVAAAGVPAPSLVESGALPSGVTFTPGTGVLGGTPGAAAGGTYNLTFTAHNGSGADAVQNFTLIVDQAAAITSTNNTTFTIGAQGNFTVAATGFPAPTFSETGTLPGGVTLNSSTGALSGIPAGGSAGNYPITITAHNGVGADATQPFTLTVNQAPVITSATSTTFTAGSVGTFTITATGSPAPSLSETGLLPTGVTFNTGTGVLSGTPGAGSGGTYPISFKAHNGVGTDATQSFNLTVDESAVITSANSTSFVLNAPATFTVTATGFPTPTLAESGALPTGVTFNTSTGVLGGTPASSGTFPITFTAHNGVGSDATQSFTLTSAAPTCSTNCTISGTITGPWVPGVTISRSGSVTTVLTDAGGNYSFTGLAGGTYTITPSLAGYNFSPSPASVTISGNTTTQNFVQTSAMPSFSISGTLSGSSTAGIVYIRVSNCGTNCNSSAGTTLASVSTNGGSYTVRGLAPGNNYSVSAEIDTLNTGAPNESNPAGSISGISITNADVTGANIIISNRSPVTPVTPNKPNVFPGNGSAFINYKQTRDNNGEEIATSYKIYYGTDTAASNVGSVQIPAGDSNNVFVLSGLTNGTPYYFKMTALNVNGESAASSVFGPVTIGATSGANTVSGTITFSGITPPAGSALYVGMFSNTTGVYFERIANPSNPTQAYSVAGIPAGTYQNFAILDVSGTGFIRAGDVSNFGSNGPPTLAVNSSISGHNITLVDVAAKTFVATSHDRPIVGADTYSITLASDFGSKRPVSMTLFSGNNVAVPFDMVAERNNSFSPIFNNSVRPLTTDSYVILVSFSDGSTPQNIPVTVSTVLDTFATSQAMNINSPNSNILPLLTWAAPSPLPAFLYSYGVGLILPNGNEFWNYNGGNNSNGIPSTQLSVPFNTDNSANPNPSLTPGLSYDWSVTVQDDNGNRATIHAPYVP